jgi:aprataxin
MPLDLSLQSLNDLNASHVSVLIDMIAAADAYTNFLQRTTHADLRFIHGFHAIPSLPMLHMHLLSMDLQSPCLKKKSHYNSFATHFFLPSAVVLQELKLHGKVVSNQRVEELERLEKQDLKCLWCGSTAYTQLPLLKAHIAACPQNRSRIVVR